MRFEADSPFAPKWFKASSLKEAVMQRMIQRKRAYDTMNWCGRNKSRLCDCLARAAKKWEALAYWSIWACVLYMCVGRHVYVPIFVSVRNITFRKIQIEDAFSPVSENGMWSGPMLLFDRSSLASDLWLPFSDLHGQGQTVLKPFWTGRITFHLRCRASTLYLGTPPQPSL